MDGNRFDDLTRAIQRGASRRRVLGIVGGAFAAALGGRRASGAPDGKVGICHRTGKGSFKYIRVSWNAAPAYAAHGDAIDVDLQNDGDNCGACGNVCGGDGCNTPVCENGVCATVPGTCEAPDACSTVYCDPDLGCVYEAVVCDPPDACTVASCDPALGCVFEEVHCEAPDACTFGICDPVQGCIYEPVICEDGNPCTSDVCDQTFGCRYDPLPGESCTTFDGAPGICDGTDQCQPEPGP